MTYYYKSSLNNCQRGVFMCLNVSLKQVLYWIPAAFMTTRSVHLKVYKSKSHTH